MIAQWKAAASRPQSKTLRIPIAKKMIFTPSIDIPNLETNCLFAPFQQGAPRPLACW
jgi:hypothetical protein